ncbi:hypothetical protein [Goodfellowiella coeruleoviolacea]|nr:hypothetical protein [Goodfellowiella coeruleoviolacea]
MIRTDQALTWLRQVNCTDQALTWLRQVIRTENTASDTEGET